MIIAAKLENKKNNADVTFSIQIITLAVHSGSQIDIESVERTDNKS